jgi:hypothetical protein
MVALALTPENLRYVKGLLRAELATVGSSRLSEAIAAGLGYRTHAALLAGIADGRGASNMSESRFLARLSEFGVPAPHGFVERAARAPGLPTPMWREFKATDRYGQDQWFYNCRRRDVPFVRVITRRKLACLAWDWISTDATYDDHVRGSASRELVHLMFNTFRARAAGSKRAFFEGSAFVGEVDHLQLDQARTLADDYGIVFWGVMVRHQLTKSPTG